MANGARIDPYGKFRFKVEVDGVTLAHFQSVSGLTHEIEVLTYQEGGVNDRQHKLPGQGSYPNITFKQGYVHTAFLEDWHFNFSKKPGAVGRKTGSIILLGDEGTEIGRWNFERAWPVKWEGPEFDSGQSEHHVESVEIAHEGIKRG